MEDFTALIGREMIGRTEETRRLFELEDEMHESVKRAAES